MKLSSRKKIILVIFSAAVGASFAGYLFGWLALHTKSITAALEATEAKLALLEYERKTVRQIEKHLDEKKPLVARFRTILVDHARPISFLDSLTELGKITGNKIVLDYAEQESDAESLVFRLTVEGASVSAAKYLKLLELMPYALAVEQMNWQSITTQQKSSEQIADTRMLLTIRVKSKL